MKDIQFNRNISKEMWDELHDTEIVPETFPVRVFNAIRRAGYETLGELADSTESELRKKLQTVRRIEVYGLEKTVQAVKEKMAAMGVVFPTDEEKQTILSSLTETGKLQREINLLQQKVEQLETENASLRRQADHYWNDKRTKSQEALLEAKELTTEGYAVPKMIQRMQYLGRDGGYTSFCDVFGLREKYCVFDDSVVCSFTEEEIQTACEKCIDKFLRKYYGIEV